MTKHQRGALNWLPLKLLLLAALAIAAWAPVASAADFQLSWIDNANNESGFAIERKTGTSGTFAQRATVGANVTSYIDAGLAAAATFCYRVRAFNSGGNSAYTPEACKTTPSSSTFSFSLAHGGNKSVTRGQSASNVITATLSSGATQLISFSTSGLPSGAAASYSTSNSCSPTCSRTLNVTTLSSTQTGIYPITITAKGGGISRTTTFNLTVTSATSANLVTLEAESGSLTAPMAIRSDSTASNGKFVEVPQGSGDNFSDATNGGPGQVHFAVSISQAATRALWARTKAPNAYNDSFYVTRNGALVSEWQVPPSTSWKWNKVANLSLASGTENLAFRLREDGTQLDQIILTTDLNFVPGQSAPALAALSLSASDGRVLSINVVKTLTSAGSGDGTVTASAGGIACGKDCAETYSSGALVTLVASAAAGSSFAGWSGDADCQDGAVTMNSDIACTATFTAQGFGLHITKSGSGAGSVVSNPSGINCGSDCSEPFAGGASATLTATAASGSIFKGWSGGGCSGTIKCSVEVNGSTSVNAVFETNESDHVAAKIGIYRPSSGDVFLDQNGNGEWEGCSGDICMKWLAHAGGVPVAGDWDGSGTTRIGTFDGASGAWYLDRNGNGRWDGCAVDVCIRSFGAAGDFPALTANGTNRPTLGIYRAPAGIWQFDTNDNSLDDECHIDTCYSKFGGRAMFGIVGDWDGNGKSAIATFEPKSGSWFIDANGNGMRNNCSVDKCYSGFGQTGDVAVAGDWDGNGKTKIGVFRPGTGEWFLDKNGNGRLDSCGEDICISAFGQPGDRPLVGKWLGAGSP